MRRISYGEAPAAGREWDAGTIWFRNGDGRQQAARCESVCPSLPWSPGCLTHVDGPRVDMQLARFSRELPRLFLCGHSIFAPGSPFAWRAVQPDCSAAARALSSMPFSAVPLSLLGLPAQWPVAFHTCPRISSQAGFPSRTERWKPRIGGTVSLRFRQTREVRKARYYLHGIPHTQRSSPTHEVSILLEGWGGIHGELLEAPSGNHDPCGRHRQR